MRSEGKELKKRQSSEGRFFFNGLAQGISVFGFAPVLSMPAFISIIITRENGSSAMLDLGIAILFGFLLPSLTMYSFVRVKGITYDKRESRLVPLLSVSAVYFSGTIVLALMSEPASATVLMFCYGTNTLAIYFISLKWKISVHAMGVAGPATALIFSIGTAGGILGLLMLPVAWSRFYLKKHTPSQVVYGGLLGYVLTSVQFMLIGNFILHGISYGLAIPLTIAVLALPLIVFASYSSSLYFRTWFFVLILYSILIGYLIASVSLIRVDYLLLSILTLFMAMLTLPASENSRTRIFHNLLHAKADPD